MKWCRRKYTSKRPGSCVCVWCKHTDQTEGKICNFLNSGAKAKKNWVFALMAKDFWKMVGAYESNLVLAGDDASEPDTKLQRKRSEKQ